MALMSVVQKHAIATNAAKITSDTAETIRSALILSPNNHAPPPPSGTRTAPGDDRAIAEQLVGGEHLPT